jgi:RNA polymerase sigma-70 factor (ECF subfamily)
MNETDTEIFEAERPVLMALAYRMLGERSASEDIVQDTWLRWQGTDRTRVETPPAWLRTAATRIAIDALRSAHKRREVYVGPWLPEPLMESSEAGPEDAYILAQECELALLWAMERLSPQHRAAFILREAFGATYADIAYTLRRNEVTCRKMVSRARDHVRQAAPSYDVSDAETADLLARFAMAVKAQDMPAVMSLLAPDATAYTDGGGKVRAALRPLIGAEEIASVLMSVTAKSDGSEAIIMTRANGTVALALLEGGASDMLTVIAPDEAGRIAWIYVMRNPDKLPVTQASN